MPTLILAQITSRLLNADIEAFNLTKQREPLYCSKAELISLKIAKRANFKFRNAKRSERNWIKKESFCYCWYKIRLGAHLNLNVA